MSRAERPAQILGQLLLGKFVARALGLVAELRIADLLAAGPRAIEDLADATGSAVDPLYRVLRALAAVGVFTEGPAREFALTAVGELLRADARGSMRAFAHWIGAEPAGWRAWGALDHAVRTGESAFEASEGAPVFSYLAATPAAGALFDAMMSGAGEADAQAVAQAYDFSWLAPQVVDVGGNQGALLLAIRERCPQLRAINLDTPPVIARASAALAASGRTGQIALQAGDFFAAVPRGELYILKRILHDWSDDRALEILRRCRDCMAPGGRVLVIERPIGDDARSRLATLMDLEMLVMTPGGRERTIAEYAGLCTQAGLQLAQVIPTAGALTILEAASDDSPQRRRLSPGARGQPIVRAGASRAGGLACDRSPRRRRLRGRAAARRRRSPGAGPRPSASRPSG